MIDEVKNRFRLLIPVSAIGNLTDILAAAWELYYDRELWAGTISKEERVETLNELVLKSIEILEFEERTKDPHDSEM